LSGNEEPRSRWDDLRWVVVLNGIADAWLWAFDADGWLLRYEDPAMGRLGILPTTGGRVATMDDALWLADVLAFDHDAPVGVQPTVEGLWPDAKVRDPDAIPPNAPVQAEGFLDGFWYWQTLNESLGAAAELRFSGSYVVRYDPEDPRAPTANFSARFSGREELVGMYAMAARQADLLSEYLCLYRILEAADGSNGKAFSKVNLERIATRDFGELRIIGLDMKYATALNAFEVYRQRALQELAALKAEGISDVPWYLYDIRNSIAHGKSNVLHARSGERFVRTARALPLVKLLARIAVEPL
jgi:hypothetical protein